MLYNDWMVILVLLHDLRSGVMSLHLCEIRFNYVCISQPSNLINIFSFKSAYMRIYTVNVAPEQWFTNTVFRTACDSQTPLVCAALGSLLIKPLIFWATDFVPLQSKMCQLACVKISLVRLSKKVVCLDLDPFNVNFENHSSRVISFLTKQCKN